MSVLFLEKICSITNVLMQVAVVDIGRVRPTAVYEHDWVHILYIGISTVFYVIEVCQRISVDLYYSSKNINISSHVPSFNRYPTELTPSPFSISIVWYLVFVWQGLWTVYSLIGIFRRTSPGAYFYQYPCAMNKWCFFYIAFGLILYTPQLAAASRNKYSVWISIFRYVGTMCEVLLTVVVVHASLWENLKEYLRHKLFVDVWLTRLLYQNGLALWTSVLFYDSCLSIVIGLIYSNSISSSMATTIGCFLLLIGLVLLSICENILFYNSLAFTLSPWFTFLWLFSGLVFQSNHQVSSSLYCIWLIRILFGLTCILTCIRLCLFMWRYCHKVIPTFAPPRIYSLIIEPRPF